jgi:putative redox protein
MAYVTVINEHQHVQKVVSGQHQLTADATASAGGSDAGFAPRELLLASLGACTAIALRKHAIGKNWALGEITVELRWSRGDAGRGHIDRRLSFSMPLSEEQRRHLLDVAAETLVTGLLQAGIPIRSSVVDGEAERQQKLKSARVPASRSTATLLKASGPEIAVMQGRERRSIPDLPTFNYMGLDSGAVQTIPDIVWASIPAGPLLPSRSDGTLLTGSAPEAYVMASGQRHLIPDPATFAVLGHSWADVQHVGDSDLNAIPLGAPIPAGGELRPAVSLRSPPKRTGWGQ